MVLQLLERRDQMVPPARRPRVSAGLADAYLGSRSTQIAGGIVAPRASVGYGERLPRIAFLRARHFRPDGRAERIRRSLAALDAANPIHLDAETWRWIAEDQEVGEIGRW